MTTSTLPARGFFAQRVPTARLQFQNLERETRWLLGFAVLYVVAAVLIGLAIRAWPLPILGASEFQQDVWYTIVFKIGLLLVLPLAVHRRWGYRWTDLLHGWRLSARSGLVLAVCYPIGVLVNAGRFAEIKVAWAQHGHADAVVRVAIGMVLAFLQAGFPEEVVYRGMLQSRLEAAWGRVAAIVVSVLLFTAWHLPTRYFNAHGIEGQAGDFMSVLVGTGVPVAIAGMIFALAWDRWRNLPALIALHGGVDTLPMVSSMIQAVARGTR